MATENSNFSVTVDFTGVEPWDPTRGGVNDPEPGAYAGKVVAAVEYVKDEGRKSIKVTVALEGAGTTDLYLGLDFSKPSNVQKMATALLSIGIPAAKLPLVKALVPALFMGQDGKGRPCHVLVKLVEGVDDKNRKKLNDKDWMSPEQFAAYKSSPAAQRPAPTAAGTANGAGPAAPAAAAGDLGGLFN